MNVYCIFDKVSEEFGQPFVMKNDEMAKRSFIQYCSKSEIKNDLILVNIGLFDNEDGSLTDLKNEIILKGEDIE